MAKKLSKKDKMEAWNAYSKYIRVRDCLKTTGLPFVGVCITCERKFHINQLEAGHCFSGRTNVKLFNDKFTNAQCRYCNQVMHGNPKKYRKIMEAKYGKEYVARQEARFKRKIIQDKDVNFIERKKRYERKKERLIKNVSIKG